MLTTGHSTMVAPGSVRPLTTMKLVRSLSFPATSRPHLFASIPQAQRRLYSPIARTNQVNKSRSSLNSSGTATQTRSKSIWYGRPAHPWSIPTQWHISSCKWVRTETDPRTTPRDLDCSACQAEEASIHEMSARELQWEKQMREVTQWIEENPYRALFGNSEDRLKGLVSEGWKSHWDPMSGRLKRTRENIEVLNKVVRGEVIDLDKDASKIVYKQVRTGQADSGAGSSPPQMQQTSKPVITSQDSNIAIKAEGYWSSYTNNNGGVSEASGKLRYDPITMRLVADESKDDATPVQNVTEDKWPRKVPVAQEPVILPPATSSPSSSQVKSEDAHAVKEKLERSFAEVRKGIKTQSEEYHKTPTTNTVADPMGAAWRREQSGTVQATSTTAPQSASSLDSMVAQTKTSMESAWTSEKHNSSVNSTNNNPHYLGQSKPLLSHEAQLASMSLKKKDKPLRHMRGWELGQHKASLLASWSKKSADETKVDRSQEHLNNEVQKQKTAFTSHEDKWRLRNAHFTTSVHSAVANTVPEPSTVAASDQIKNKLREKEDANALVRDVREIYENAYGVIDTTHRQGDIKAVSSPFNVAATDSLTSQKDAEISAQEAYDDALSDYDRKMGSSGYDFKQGQDGLEEEVKNKGVSDALKPPTEEPKSKQYKLSDIIKKPSSTNMSPVNPIDGMTRPKTFAEYMDAQTFSPTGFSSPDHYQFLSETQPTVELEDDTKVSAPPSGEIETNAAVHTFSELNRSNVSSAQSGSPSMTTSPDHSKSSAWTTLEEAEVQSFRSINNGKPPRWTPSEGSLMKELHSRGLSAEDLAGIRRLRRWTSHEIATLQRLDRQGLTVRDVAMLSAKPAEWTREETNKLTMVLAQNLPAAYRSAAEDVAELQALYEKGLGSADVIATKRLSRWSPKEMALLERMSVRDIMILDKQRQETQPSSRTSELATNNRIVRKQESVFSGGPVNATSSTEEPRISKRRKRSAKPVAESSAEATFASSADKMANANTAGRYPSSFLHSTRTYMPTGSLFDSGSGGSGNGTSSSSEENGRRGGFNRKLKAAGYIAAACYATGLTIEHLRSGTSPTPSSTSATGEAVNANARAPRESASRKRKNETATPEVSPVAATTALPKEEDTYIEAAKREYQRNAWGDELLSKRDTVANADATTFAPSSLPSTTTAVTTVAGTAQAKSAPVVASPVPTTKAETQEGYGAGGMEGLAALGAGVMAAVVVLLGGFGGS